nr:phosphodiester glycosidase family protein [Pseudohalocynthiibacter aestuariivivens]
MLRWILAAAVLFPVPLVAADCRHVNFDGAEYAICEVDMTTERLQLFLTDTAGAPLGSFDNVDALLAPAGVQLGFAMNAGMYHSDRSPVGLYIEDGAERAKVVTRDGPGNFGLLPNGVFCVRQGRADVIETRRYVREAPDCTHASQSGPMLVIDGQLHPRFLKESDSLYVRNGVGTSADGTRAVFAISQAPVNFHAFGRLFRDHLKLPQALYFDGNISRLYAPNLGRHDIGFPMGPIVGTVVPGE